MKHYFNIEIATKYGMLEAVLLENIHYWIEKNKTDGRNFYDGKYWTYNSVKKFAELFPYASEKKIRSAIKVLREEGILDVGNYNQHKMDKTLWYSFTEKGETLFNGHKNDVYSSCNADAMENPDIVDNVDILDNFEHQSAKDTIMVNPDSKTRHSIVPKEEYDVSKKANRNALEGKAIPYINTDSNNTDIKTNIDPYISYTFIYNDKTMDLMRVAEGRTYSTGIKHDYTPRESYSANSRSMGMNRDTSRSVFDRPESKYKSKNKFLQFEQHEYTKSDIDMFEMAILRKQERMLC